MSEPRAIQVFPAGQWPLHAAAGCVTLEFDDRYRRRARLTLDQGGDFILDLPRAGRLCDGDGLLLEDGRYVLVRAAPEDIMDITSNHPDDAIRIAWHLGNRHLPVQVLRNGALRLRYDHVIEHMVVDLGGVVQRHRDVFAPEPGAYEGRMGMGMGMIMMNRMNTDSSLYRLLAWLSPAFPVGAFSYSHGLEYAVEAGLVTGRDDLVAWIAGLLRHGTALNDVMLFVGAWRALDAQDAAALREITALSAAMRPTSEMALESQAQGAAFARAISDAWPHPDLDAVLPLKDAGSYPMAVALCAHAHGIEMGAALAAYLHAFTANLISAGVRLIPLGQTAGQIALRLLEPEVAGAAEMAQSLPLSELGGAAPMLDFCSAQHETQYTRLFRS